MLNMLMEKHVSFDSVIMKRNVGTEYNLIVMRNQKLVYCKRLTG